jgi:hypothetical protein
MRAPSISFLFPNGPVNPTVPPVVLVSVIATEADDGITTESGDEIITE